MATNEPQHADETRPLSEDLGLGDTTPAAGPEEDPARGSHEDRPRGSHEDLPHGSHEDRPHEAGSTDHGGPRIYGEPPVYRRGPAPFAVFLGLLGLLVAGVVMVEEVADVSVDWATLGPWTVVAGGLVVVLVGLLGLRANRRAD